MAGDAGRLPDAELLVMLDADSQGWALARSVREGGHIVDFELTYVNDAGCRLLGRAREALLGVRCRRLWPDAMHDGTLRLYRQVVERRKPMTRTVYHDRATLSGHFELSVGPFGDGFAARFVDLRQLTVAPQSAGGKQVWFELRRP
ncbi:PAS domain-containing protein [Dactylosporangium roseum]|uniref:PAS domain-containing protein n=1 Tax=Dactylosporangium roseum TaxID=47989 RepID=A0ABY5YYQ1_9ACTN|nr:PAS domain-containing protein [Dactylosporangium roseum]UWZ33945.1 PAS domain-containing protein [Dactylosporangium roseum]